MVLGVQVRKHIRVVPLLLQQFKQSLRFNNLQGVSIISRPRGVVLLGPSLPL